MPLHGRVLEPYGPRSCHVSCLVVVGQWGGGVGDKEKGRYGSTQPQNAKCPSIGESSESVIQKKKLAPFLGQSRERRQVMTLEGGRKARTEMCGTGEIPVCILHAHYGRHEKAVRDGGPSGSRQWRIRCGSVEVRRVGDEMEKEKMGRQQLPCYAQKLQHAAR